MKYTSPGHFKSADAFRDHLRSTDPQLDCVLETTGSSGPLGQSLQVGERSIGNRFAVHPMEGWDGNPDGSPSDLTRRRWHRFGRSGAKLIWGGEAFAVQEDGKANPNQLYLNPTRDVTAFLSELRGEVLAGHEAVEESVDDLFIGLQLTHSGRFSRPSSAGLAPRTAYRHPILDEKFGIDSDDVVLTDGELEAIGENYIQGARHAQEAGFDFVDVKCCHGYLLHELLGARARSGSYGGSFENRLRFFRQVVNGIRSACPGLEIGVRVSIADVFPYSKNPDTGLGEPRDWESRVPFEHGFGIDAQDPRAFDLQEPLAFLRTLTEMDISLVNLTLGSPYYCPHLQRPATFPPSDGYGPPEDPITGVAKHLLTVREIRRACPDLVLVGTGYSYLQQYLPNVAEHEVGAGHVDFVGLGRMILSYPELPRDVLAGRTLERRLICRTFSDCTTAPRNGMISGCYPLDSHYKKLPEAERVRELKKRMRAEE